MALVMMPAPPTNNVSSPTEAVCVECAEPGRDRLTSSNEAPAYIIRCISSTGRSLGWMDRTAPPLLGLVDLRMRNGPALCARLVGRWPIQPPPFFILLTGGRWVVPRALYSILLPW